MPTIDQNVMPMIMMVGFIALFYFMLIRPQKLQQKKREEMLNALKAGDKVLTAGGLFGTIKEVRDKSIRVKIANDVVVRMSKSGIQSLTSGKEEGE